MKLELKLALLAFVLAVAASLGFGYSREVKPMTYPITETGWLREALVFLSVNTPLSVRDQHGNQLQLAGVEHQLNDAEEIVGFVLVVAPKEKP